MPELLLQQVAGNTYYIPSPTNVGVYLAGREAILIDSGSDEEAARQILRALQKNELTLRLIINTHSHADHIGGNLFLQKRTGCAIAATPEEAALIENTGLETAILYGGYPLAGLHNKFLHAKPATVQHRIGAAGPILDTGLEALPLPGHSGGMIGVRTPDRVLFLADSLLAPRVIEKYHLFYLWDVEAHLRTLTALPSLAADLLIPSHTQPLTDLRETIRLNKAKIEEIAASLRDICRTAVNTEEIFQQICRKYAVALNTNGYVLGMSTVRSYLAYLENQNVIEHFFDEEQLKWRVK